MNVDEAIQRILIGVGLITVVAGIVMFVNEGIAAAFPFGGITVGATGVIGLVLGMYLARSRFRGELTETVTPDPELPPYNAAPGDDIDRMLVQLTELRQGTIEYRERIQERLRNAAIAVVKQRDDCTREEAVRKIETGEWTDNATAAAFFGADVSGSSRGSLLDSILGGDDGYERHVETTVNAIAQRADVDVEVSVRDDDDVVDRVKRTLGFSGDDEEELQQANWNADKSTIESFDTAVGFHDVGEHTTNRWLGVSAFALLAIGLGVFASQPALMLAGIIGVAFTAYARIGTTPPTQTLDVERQVSEENPQPGDAVQVTVRVENTGNTFLPDLRLVDIVPDPMIVTNGSPRLATALRPGSSVTFSYTVIAQRGEHTWPLLVVARDFSGAIERDSLVTPETTMNCVPSLATANSMPVRPQTSQYAGGVNTKIGGSGLEFFAQREYRSGDPMNRVNWKRLAKTGELATVEFREEKAAMVTLLFDARDSANLAPEPGEPHAVDRAVGAATDVFASLYDEGDLVGIAAFDTVPCWLAPGAGSEHLERARLTFAHHPALSSTPPSRLDHEQQYVDPMTHVRRQLPTSSQIVMFSPLNDDYAYEVARQLDSAGHLVTVVSPNVTADRTLGQRLARIERAMRLIALREHGIRVIDWEPGERFALEMQRAQQRWMA